jgi:translation initiation factor IF-2
MGFLTIFIKNWSRKEKCTKWTSGRNSRLLLKVKNVKRITETSYLCLSKKFGVMKKLLLIVAAAGFIGCQMRTSKTAGEQPVDPVRDPANFTSIQWLDSTDQDLGTVKEGPEVEIAYKFKNTGDKNLVIEDVTAGCGCTIVEKPKEPYMPGQTGTIKAKFTTQGHAGTNNKSIYVTANTKGSVHKELKFHIVVEKS